jgi:diacylglycerol kinase family enzyme
MLVAGAGFDADVMRSATRSLKERWGFGAYIYAAVKESLSARPVASTSPPTAGSSRWTRYP